MVFSSNIFLFLFLPITLALYFLPLHKVGFIKYKNYLLLTVSLFFYAWGEACYLWLLGLSIVGNYCFGLWIGGLGEGSGGRSGDGSHSVSNSASSKKNLQIFLAVSFNLALLLYFKYAVFLAQNFSLLSGFQISQSLLPQRLPIGISFFTFHAISYLVDIYRHKCKPQKSLLDLALYIAFFPQLIAGPIVRYNTIAKYLHERRHSLGSAAYGVRRFIIGFAKKIIIANPLGEVADAIFSSSLGELNTTLAWIGIACYTMQIYFDFSGYSDMAIGLARLFGFKFPENFNYPYVSKSIKEFWRRWHMSLSAWFRDYVYIPLGGNRVGLFWQYFNLVLVFFLCGLWHGASWNFVIWGLFHGFFLVLERLRIGHFILEKMPSLLRHVYVMLVVMIGWVFFRSHDLSFATGYLHLMFVGGGDVVVASKIAHLISSHAVWTVFGLSILGFSPLVQHVLNRGARVAVIGFVAVDVALLLVFIFAIIRLSAATHNPFIYFQF